MRTFFLLNVGGIKFVELLVVLLSFVSKLYKSTLLPVHNKREYIASIEMYHIHRYPNTFYHLLTVGQEAEGCNSNTQYYAIHSDSDFIIIYKTLQKN